MMLRMELAGVLGVIVGVSGVAGGDVSVMSRLLMIAGFMVRGGFAVMVGGLLVMVRSVGVMFVGGVSRRHYDLPILDERIAFDHLRESIRTDPVD
jgi:hypothetical protein